MSDEMTDTDLYIQGISSLNKGEQIIKMEYLTNEINTMLVEVWLQIEGASNSAWVIQGRLPNETGLLNWAYSDLFTKHFLVK